LNSKNLILFILSNLFLFESCVYYVWKKEFEKDDRNQNALILSLLDVIQNPNQELFAFIPGPSRNFSDTQFVESSLHTPTDKPKLIFIHGWNPIERDTDPFTSRIRKIQNIEGTFSNAIIHFQENQNNVNSTFDLYAFTYRTSNGVVFNGEGFLKFLTLKFKISDKIIVVAHSMGGLVTRAAMKSNNYSAGLIDGVITLASPVFGSPFASKKYLANQTFASELSSFLIETQGGTDLGYTNNGNGQIEILEESNVVLDYINNGFIYNSIFVNFSGVLSPCSGAETFYYTTGCQILSNSSPSFPLNDGIVSENSAMMGNTGIRSFRKTGFDHSMMSFQTKNIDDSSNILYFNEMVTQAKALLGN